MTDPAVMGLADAAQLLDMDKSTAYRLARRGEFPVPVLTIGRLKKVSRRALTAYIDGASSQAAS